MALKVLDATRQRWVLAALEQYEGPLLRYAQRLVVDEHAARDLVQYAFLKLCDRSPEDIRHGVGAWLYAVCRNRAIDLQRKERRVEHVSHEESLFRACDQLDPAEQCQANDVGRQLHRLVETLSPDQQAVVDLWSEGFSYREISRITDRKENTIRVQVHRALKELREHPLVRQLLADHADFAAKG